MNLRTLGLVIVVAASGLAKAQDQPAFVGLNNVFFNEDFAESSGAIAPAQWYTLFNKNFDVNYALSGQRWYPEYYKSFQTGQPNIAWQHAYLGYWGNTNSSTPPLGLNYTSYAYINMDQGAATFGTPNSGGNNQIGGGGGADRMLKAPKGPLNMGPMQIGEAGTMEYSSLPEYLRRVEPTAGLTAFQQSPPAGGGIARIFPYVYVGPSPSTSPNYGSPFTASGSFWFEVGVQMTGHIGVDGCGIDVRYWADNTPVGGSPSNWLISGPIQDGNPLQNVSGNYPNQDILRIWSGSNSVTVNLLGYVGTGYPGRSYSLTTNPTSMHVYRVQGALSTTPGLYNYTVYIDGVQITSLTGSSTIRPNCIWMGNPVFNWWTPGPDWQTMAVDYVRTG